MRSNQEMRTRIARAFKRNPQRENCPLCGTTELLSVFPDQFCMKCDWDSLEAYVKNGKMNDLNQAYFEHFIMPKISASPAGNKGGAK